MRCIAFELANRRGDPLRGDLRWVEAPRPAPVVVVCHGFKGFKNWGFFPYTGERLAQADVLATLSHEHILRERVVVGSAESLVKRLRELRDQLRLDGIIVEPNPGGMIPLDNMMRSLKLLAEEVAPSLR
jgi:alkanesulfonate monooxygenase SsuD/methylene tetrahydromethanopterin reductase-like flavin-dependent oxidoreductase (luciferase family)